MQYPKARFVFWPFLLLTGSRSFGRKSLHHIGTGQNPYEQAISIIGKTLSAFDEDNLIPCFGFGDGNSMEALLQASFLCCLDHRIDTFLLYSCSIYT